MGKNGHPNIPVAFPNNAPVLCSGVTLKSNACAKMVTISKKHHANAERFSVLQHRSSTLRLRNASPKLEQLSSNLKNAERQVTLISGKFGIKQRTSAYVFQITIKLNAVLAVQEILELVGVLFVQQIVLLKENVMGLRDGMETWVGVGAKAFSVVLGGCE